MGKQQVTRASPVTTRRALIGALFHGHDGPIYGLILSEKDGVANVEFKDEHGIQVIVDLPMDVLEIGERVDSSFECHEAMELRFRFWVAPYKNSRPEEEKEDGDQENVWCQGQVESVILVDEVWHVKFRGRCISKSLIVPVSTFLDQCIPSNKEDYLLGVADRCRDMSYVEVKNLISSIDRNQMAMDMEKVEVHNFLSRVGAPVTVKSGPVVQPETVKGKSVEKEVGKYVKPLTPRPYKSITEKKAKRTARRMRTRRTSTRTGSKAHGMDSSSYDDTSEDEDDGWTPRPCATDAVDAGYGGSGGGYDSKERREGSFPRKNLNGGRGVSASRRGGSQGKGSRVDARQGKKKKKDVDENKAGPSKKAESENESDGSDKGTSWHNSDRSESQPGVKWNVKHEYCPRAGARSRHELIFKEEALLTLWGEPGEKLDTILRNERASTPGFTLGHASALYGFDFGIQPVPIWDIVNEGGGQLRTVEDANTNKAIISSLKKLEIRLTKMSQLVNVSYNLTSIFGRWYRAPLVEIAVIIDQEIRGACLAEGMDAPQPVVDAYVALVEGVLGDVASTLSKTKKEEFDEVMMKEIDKVRYTLSPASKLHQRTVYQAHKKVMGEVVNRRQDRRGGDDRNKRVDIDERPKKKPRGAGGNEAVPSFVVSALKVDGKSMCIANALDHGCDRGKDKCRFEHGDLPKNLDPKVVEWIKNQNKKKSQ